MNEEMVNMEVEIMGKTYQIKCPEAEAHSLKNSAQYLEEKMRDMRDNGNVLSIDRLAVITALNVVHQLLTLEHQKLVQGQSLKQRISHIQSRIETALAKNAQMELESAS